MDALAGNNPSPSPDPAPIRERPDLAGAIDESRQGLAQLIGRAPGPAMAPRPSSARTGSPRSRPTRPGSPRLRKPARSAPIL